MGRKVNRYIYKLYFKNGCTYVGKHSELKRNDGYVTSSSYYKKHKDLFERREILIDNLPDIDTLDIMESLCIMADVCDNPLNVNYNRGAWLDPSKFYRGYSGPANAMYGKRMTDIMGEEAFKGLVRRQVETRRKNYLERNKDFIESHNGMTPKEYRKLQKQKRIEHNSLIREINKQIKAAHKSAYEAERSRKHYWFYNPETLVETYQPECPDGFVKGRLPHSLWSEERKKSYAEKHNFNPFRDWDTARKEEYAQIQADRQKGKVCYTDGEHNIYLYQGQDIPEGYYKGCTFTKSELYIATRKKKGHNNKGEKVNNG
jgi:hypothetical protein